MNSKRIKGITFGIGIALAMLAVLTAPAMAGAGPNTMYFTNYSGDTSPGGLSYVELWVNITDAHGENPIYGWKAADINITLDPSVGVAIGYTEMGLEWEGPGTADLWANFWTCTVNGLHDGWWLSINSDYGPNPPDPTPWGMLPGLYPIANFTIEGNNTGMAILHFNCNHPLPWQSQMGDFIGSVYPNQIWEDDEYICGPPETFTKSLDLGWNLISLPLTPLNDSTSAVLGNDTFVYDKVYRYDASTNLFVDVTDGTMEIGVGYFVDVTTEGTWLYEGYGNLMPPDVGDLEQGLNCIGWTNTSATLPDALGNMGSYCDWWYVSRWNATSQKYELYDADAPEGVPEFIDFDTMERGEGYFIVTKNPYCTFAYP